MSILDGLSKDDGEIEGASKYAFAVIESYLEQNPLAPRVQAAIDGLKDGLPLSSVLRVTDEECGALFDQACRDIQFGEIKRARDALLLLHVLQPLEARFVYVLGTTFQISGDPATAGKLYIQFLARDATNPDGYLRLGECFLSNKEYDMARDTFQLAIEHASHGSSPDKVRTHARRMIELIETERDGG
jgi:tetratricopeptide (TPR) repeat protein